MTLLELISEIVPGERGTINVCLRSKSYGQDELEHFIQKALPILRKHNIQVRLKTNTNGMNGVWLEMEKYVMSRPNHGIWNWGFEYESVLELCKTCNVKIGAERHNYILNQDGEVEEVIDGV